MEQAGICFHPSRSVCTAAKYVFRSSQKEGGDRLRVEDSYVCVKEGRWGGGGSCWIASYVVISRLSPPGWGKKSGIKTVSVLKMWPPHHDFFCLVGTRKEFTDLSSARHYPNTPHPPHTPPPPAPFFHTHPYPCLFVSQPPWGFFHVTLCDLHPRPDKQE